MLSLSLTLLILISIIGASSIVGAALHTTSGQVLKPTIKADSCPFLADPRTGVYHYANCPVLKTKTNPENRTRFNNPCDAIALGYWSSRVCHLPGRNSPLPTPALVPAPTPTPPMLISTTLLIQGPKNAVHVGDSITITGTLTHSETMDGIAGATITVKLSLDGKNWVTIDNKETDSKGSIRYTITVPDPRSYGQKLPVVLGYKFSYDGSDTYLGSDAVCNITVVS